MFTQFMQYSDTGLFLLRLAVAIVFLVHGFPKLLKAKEMSLGMGMPSMMIFLLGVIEVVSSLGLASGYYTQLSAILLVLIMLGALGMKAMKWKVPFAARDKTGWEFDFILLVANLAIFLTGGGRIGF